MSDERIVNLAKRLLQADPEGNVITEFKKGGGIHIKPSKRGTFTAAATKHGKSVQAFASQVLANKGNYSSAMVKKAAFAKAASKWKHGDGGLIERYGKDAIKNALSFMQKVGAMASESARDARTATASSTVKDMIDAGDTDGAYNFAKNYTKLGLLGTALGLGTGPAAPQVAHITNVLANPASATTKTGAQLATLIDAYGLTSGANGLAKDAEKAINGNYTYRDIPETLLDATVLIPGSNQFNSAKNIKNLAEAGKDLRFIPLISSKETLLNRAMHPEETYRFANIARRTNGKLPNDIYVQSLSELAQTKFHNRPSGKSWYSPLYRKPAETKLGVDHGEWPKGSDRWRKPHIWGLGDPLSTTDYSRAHEFGHLVTDAAEKQGYDILNYPHHAYEYYVGIPYSVTKKPETYLDEYFSDVFGNTVTSDMTSESIQHILDKRYPYVKNQEPMFRKRK